MMDVLTIIDLCVHIYFLSCNQAWILHDYIVPEVVIKKNDTKISINYLFGTRKVRKYGIHFYKCTFLNVEQKGVTLDSIQARHD
jgi:hypothetical protein